ncbi:MAG: hypothetical protein IKG18_06295 [Atopobiaceae bacterium]|nr:hypothetical protein [Atopobiaceae bacterium]
MGAVGLASLVMAACGGSGDTGDAAATDAATTAADGKTISGTYKKHVQGFDWGAGVDVATVTLDAPLDSADATNFEVTETKMATDFTDETFPIVEVTIPRPVTAATLEDEGKTLKLELACAPNDGDGPMIFSMATQYNTWSDPYYLTIKLAEGASVTSGGEAVAALNIDTAPQMTLTAADDWKFDDFKASDGTTFHSLLWIPEQASKTLVVWLHGLGEGGAKTEEKTDPSVTLLANKVTALGLSEFQEAVGGANVLVPQCPTYWMDADGNSSNFSGGAINADGTSFYTAALEELIDSKADELGVEKIVLAGCSNGGYMTMVLSINRPDAYAAVVPICEALEDQYITDEQIESLVDLPMYFVYSKDDTTVDPTKNEEPTIERLKAAGKTADTLHVSTTEHVVDTSGQFFMTDESGNPTEEPYQYNGHWSWIYFDNNECECDEDGLKAWEFIAENVK